MPRDIRDLNRFEEAERKVTLYDGRKVTRSVDEDDYDKKILNLAVPNIELNSEHINALKEVRAYANSLHYNVEIELVVTIVNTVYSVGVYKNKNDGMIFMIPFGFDTDGVRTGLDKPNILHNPFDSNAIGNALKKSLDIVINEEYTRENMVDITEEITGIKSTAKFTKLHLNFSAKFNPEDGYKFKPRKRYSDSSYRNFEYEVPVIKLDVNATDEEIGQAVLKTFDHCE
ncbi:hypothetical protein [Virgibacillus sp. L01]|uniref:hypothetical protein n=1 Tax=Virgibacillus sp. L01 TaxID=3457429 RepID=UPI003FD5F024